MTIRSLQIEKHVMLTNHVLVKTFYRNRYYTCIPYRNIVVLISAPTCKDLRFSYRGNRGRIIFLLDIYATLFSETFAILDLITKDIDFYLLKRNNCNIRNKRHKNSESIQQLRFL